MSAFPLADRPAVLAASTIYLALMLAVGVWAASRTRTARDFFIAGQRLGLVATGIGTMAAAFSGFVFLGGPGLTFRLGLGSLWIVVPVGFTAGLLCRVLGGRLQRLARTAGVLTVPDAVAWRFPGRAPRAAAAVAVAAGSLVYLGAQVLALGVLVRAVLGVGSLDLAMLCGTGVLLVYSLMGGMIAGAYTDLVQGALMLVVALLVFAVGLEACGGFRAMIGSIAASERFGPAFLEPLGRVEPATAFGWLLVFGVGVLGQPQMLHKFYMLRDPRHLRWLPAILGGSQALCLLVWLGVGLAVPALVAAGRLDAPVGPDDATPLFLLEVAPSALAGLALAGVLAAIMSTADSFLNIAAGALVRDLPHALGRPLSRELAWARLVLPLIAAAAVAVASRHGELIALLGTFAFGTFAAALGPALAVGLCWERVTSRAATSSILCGLGLNVGLEVASRAPSAAAWLPAAPPAALALAASFTVLFAVSLLDRRARPATVGPLTASVIADDDSVSG